MGDWKLRAFLTYLECKGGVITLIKKIGMTLLQLQEIGCRKSPILCQLANLEIFLCQLEIFDCLVCQMKK
jgi:hypothetical protein